MTPSTHAHIELARETPVRAVKPAQLFLYDGAIYMVLTGNITDQAALTGVLNTIYESHLRLIAVNALQFIGSNRAQISPDD